MAKKIASIILSLFIFISCFILVINKSYKKEKNNIKIKKEVKNYNDEIPGLNEFLNSYKYNSISLDSVVLCGDNYNIKLRINCHKQDFNSVIEDIKKYSIDDFDFIVNNDIIDGTVSITYRNS